MLLNFQRGSSVSGNFMHEFVSCMKNETDHKQEVQRFFIFLLWSISGLHLAFLFLFSHILSKYSLLKSLLCLSTPHQPLSSCLGWGLVFASRPSCFFSLLSFSSDTCMLYSLVPLSLTILLFFFRGISRISREETSDSLCEGNDCQ